MTIDFKLKTDPERQEEIYSKNGYQIEMNPITENEIPIITNSLPLLYNQTLALYGTINKGQLTDDEYFGVNPSFKRKIQNSDITSQLYQLSLLEELSDMATQLFLDNPEIMDYVSSIESVISIETMRD